MVDELPAISLLVRADGRIEAPQRLSHWLGLDTVPQYLTELPPHGSGGLTPETLAELTEAVRRTQKTAAPFRRSSPRADRSAAWRCAGIWPIGPPPGGAALVWVFDFSDSESELVKMRAEAARARGDFSRWSH